MPMALILPVEPSLWSRALAGRGLRSGLSAGRLTKPEDAVYRLLEASLDTETVDLFRVDPDEGVPKPGAEAGPSVGDCLGPPSDL
jgi:hypothetical protein